MPNTQRMRELNDAFRKGERPELGRMMITQGARHAVSAWPVGEILLVQQVRKFETFDEGNDPWCEHDYGSFEYAGEMFFWKIDPYNKTRRIRRPSRRDDHVTRAHDCIAQ